MADNMTSSPPVHTVSAEFVNFDPEEPESDIVKWCTLSETIIKQKNLDGPDLILALTQSLKGPAAMVLTEIQPDNNISWDIIKAMLISKFGKPVMIQDYFDKIIKFEIDSNENASEAGMRLCALIENIPEVNMSEKVITGFAVAVLSHFDDEIRQKCNSVDINNKNQLYCVLNDVNVKRNNDNSIVMDCRTKSFRTISQEICGDCRDTEHKLPTQSLMKLEELQQLGPRQQMCSSCGTVGQENFVCSMPFKKKIEAIPVPIANRPGRRLIANTRASNGVLQICGIQLPFIFDSGSERSLIKHSYCKYLCGTRFNKPISIQSISGHIISSNLQIKCTTVVQGLSFDVTYLSLPDAVFNEGVLLGCDILKAGIAVQLKNNNMTFVKINPNNNVPVSSDPFGDISINTDLVGEDRERLIEVLKKYSNYFINKLQPTCIKKGELKIDLIDPTKPVQIKPHEFSPKELNIIKRKIQEMLNANIIRESSSPFASPMRLEKKKDGSYFFYVDYSELNKNTRADNYPLPSVNEEIAKLRGVHHYCTIELVLSFDQIKIHEDSIEKTAFVTPTGHYEFLKMPAGLRNTPQVFQRAVHTALSDFNKDRVTIYVNHILFASETVDEGLSRLDNLLKALSDAGFIINLKNCSFMKERFEYRGFHIHSEQVTPHPNIPESFTATDAEPLTPSPENSGLRFRRMDTKLKLSKISLPPSPLLSKKELLGVQVLQLNNKQKPNLTAFNPSLPIQIYTYASSIYYGSIMVQKFKKRSKIVGLLSRLTTDKESRYHSYELETLAIVESVNYFHDRLYGRRFTILTSCQALKDLSSKEGLTPRAHKWWEIMDNYDYDIIYGEKKTSVNIDYQSYAPYKAHKGTEANDKTK